MNLLPLLLLVKLFCSKWFAFICAKESLIGFSIGIYSCFNNLLFVRDVEGFILASFVPMSVSSTSKIEHSIHTLVARKTNTNSYVHVTFNPTTELYNLDLIILFNITVC